MKIIKKLSYLLVAAIATLGVSCGDGEGNGGGGGSSKLVVTSDTYSIMADGRDRATLTATTAEGTDVTDDSEFFLEDGTKLASNRFTSSNPVTFKIRATHKEDTSEYISINVSASTLTADKESITMGSGEVVTFTLEYLGEDVSGEMVLNNITTGVSYKKGVATFTAPKYTGDFQFTATYQNLTSNTITVKVVAPEAQALKLKVSTPRVASGSSVTFTVMNEGTDVTSSATIRNATTGETITNPYTYSASTVSQDFVAEYSGSTSNTVSVGTGNFWKKVLYYKYTDLSCIWCPVLASTLENVERNNPNRMAQVAIHTGDEMTSPDYPALYRAFPPDGLPFSYINFYSPLQGSVSISQIQSAVNQYIRVAALAGISIDSTIEGNNIKVNIDVTASTANEYYIAVMLLENGILSDTPQTGADEGTKYVHNYTLRRLVTPVFGESLGQIGVNETKSWEYTFDAASYEAANCEILCYVMYKTGSDYTVTNAEKGVVNSVVSPSFEN